MDRTEKDDIYTASLRALTRTYKGSRTMSHAQYMEKVAYMQKKYSESN